MLLLTRMLGFFPESRGSQVSPEALISLTPEGLCDNMSFAAPLGNTGGIQEAQAFIQDHSYRRSFQNHAGSH